jgi:hypothetical protein
MLDFVKDRQCLWNTKSEHCRSSTARQNALQGIAQKPNFPKLTVEDVKLKIKTVRTRYAAELAKVTKNKIKKNWCRPTPHLRTEIVLVQTITFIPAWCLYSTNHSVNKGSFPQ